MFVKHILATTGDLPPATPCLYEYIFGANGIFVRATRPELDAMIWVASTATPVRGLADVQPGIEVHPAPVPGALVARMFEMAYRAGNKEILFYLSVVNNAWRLTVPEQAQGAGFVRPLDLFSGGPGTVIEVHSHHGLRAFFSSTDNAEEQTGFRVYAVIGDLYHRPEIRVRVGIYGHFWEIPASWVFDLPGGLRDAVYTELDECLEMDYAAENN